MEKKSFNFLHSDSENRIYIDSKNNDLKLLFILNYYHNFTFNFDFWQEKTILSINQSVLFIHIDTSFLLLDFSQKQQKRNRKRNALQNKQTYK